MEPRLFVRMLILIVFLSVIVMVLFNLDMMSCTVDMLGSLPQSPLTWNNFTGKVQIRQLPTDHSTDHSEGQAIADKGPVVMSLVVGDKDYKLPFHNKACYFGAQGVPWYLVVMSPAECPKPTYCKPRAVQMVLAATGRDVIVTDLDIVVKETGISFKSLFRHYKDADILVTDHNAALNNGVIYIRNNVIGNVFVEEWRKLMDGPDKQFPFTDNGAFIDLIITMNPILRSKYVLTAPSAGDFLASRMPKLAEIAGPFTGKTDRDIPISTDADGGAKGLVRLVRPSQGFNSHRCDVSGENFEATKSWGWMKESCFHNGMPWLHTKSFEKEVDPKSTICHNLLQWPINSSPLPCGHKWNATSKILEILPARSRADCLSFLNQAQNTQASDVLSTRDVIAITGVSPTSLRFHEIAERMRSLYSSAPRLLAAQQLAQAIRHYANETLSFPAHILYRQNIPANMDLARFRGPGVEIGVQKGIFSNQVLTAWRLNSMYHLIDPWAKQSDAVYNDGANQPQNIQDETMNSAQAQTAKWTDNVTLWRSFSDEAASNFEDLSLAFVYVDGNHYFEYVLRDLELYWPKLRPGGIMAGHDYSNAFDKGVPRAVEAFLRNHSTLKLHLTGEEVGGGWTFDEGLHQWVTAEKPFCCPSFWIIKPQ